MLKQHSSVPRIIILNMGHGKELKKIVCRNKGDWKASEYLQCVFSSFIIDLKVKKKSAMMSFIVFRCPHSHSLSHRPPLEPLLTGTSLGPVKGGWESN